MRKLFALLVITMVSPSIYASCDWDLRFFNKEETKAEKALEEASTAYADKDFQRASYKASQAQESAKTLEWELGIQLKRDPCDAVGLTIDNLNARISQARDIKYKAMCIESTALMDKHRYKFLGSNEPPTLKQLQAQQDTINLYGERALESCDQKTKEYIRSVISK
ncbi:hypothetical protein ACMXYN_00445 [Neptuniibacter sp. PT8_73]|uniref:hypothetical protein n=1 Tax=Neptuniibacter sp. PT8_73 TaxID=3398206 RepID=UPI0039F4CA06